MALARLALVVVTGTTLLGLACGGGGGGGTGPTRTLAKALAPNGDNQVGNADQALANSLAVIVRDPSGTPVADIAITWAVPVGGGGGTVNHPPSAKTGADGIARASLTLGHDSVSQKVTASAAGLSGSPVTFNETARIQGATQIALAPTNSGNGQTDTVLAPLGLPYRVRLTDENNASVQGVLVNWSVPGLPGQQGSVSSSSSTTDDAGIAFVNRTLGSAAGTQTASASVKGLIGSPVTFTATANAGHATQIARNGGDNQVGPINTALPVPHSVIVKDAYGNPVKDTTVNWLVGAGGGSVNPTSNKTGSDGIASSTRTLGPTPGTQTDTAKAAGLTPVVFTVTAVTASATATVQVGGDLYSVFFRSVRNGSQNPAVDTVAVGGTVTWNWVGSLPHGVESLGQPSFTSSALKTGAGNSYMFTFTAAGTYAYDCLNHGVLMTGRVVVKEP